MVNSFAGYKVLSQALLIFLSQMFLVDFQLIVMLCFAPEWFL